MTNSHLIDGDQMGIQERKEREKEARREDIVSAAEKIFLEKGVVTTTMDDIADACELSKGTLYLYYRSKEDLIVAVSMRGMDIMNQLFKEAISTDEPIIQLIENLGEAYYTFFKNHRMYFRLLYFFESPQFHSQVSPGMKEICIVHERKTWDLITDLIRRGIQEGMLHKDLDPLEVAIMLWSNSNGFLRLLDRDNTYWEEAMGISLERTLRRSSALLLEGMMTEKALQTYPRVIGEHAAARKESGDNHGQV
jgi:AcrR family transcriptional regulator